MKPTLVVGLSHTLRYRVPENRTVPYVYPESALYCALPRVFATAYMVGLLEWACIEVLAEHLDAGEQTVGTGIAVTHSAATPPGFIVTAEAALTKIEGRRLTFSVRAHDGVESITTGTHERFVIDRGRFDRKLQEKARMTTVSDK